MKVLASIVAVAIAIFLLVVVAYAGFWAAHDLLEGYQLLDLTTRATLAGVAAIVLVASLVLAAGLRSAARLLSQARLVEPRRDVYERVVLACLPLIEESAGRPQARPGAPAEPLAALAPDLLLVAGPGVIGAYGAWQRVVEQAADRTKIQASFGELLREMRRELGQPATYEESRLAWRALVTPAQASRFAGVEASQAR
jgi:hypothetical protein